MWWTLVVVLIVMLGGSPRIAAEEARLDAQPLSLEECYALTLKRSETIAIQEELLRETEGRFLQAFSGILPRATFSSSDKRQDGSGASAFTLRDVPERKFAFSQPLFLGFKEFAAMAGARAERRQHEQDKIRAEHLLFLDVVDAFSFLRQHRDELQALESTRLALTERLDELQERERLGRTRPSEVASARAQLRRIEAEWEQAQRDEVIARQLLEFLTGRSPIDAIAHPEPLPTEVESEDAYLATAAVRPDVLAAHEAWQVAKKEVAIARAKFWPTVSTEANYYTERAGAAADVEWDATLKVDVPIFQGGQVMGAVREASSRARQAQLQLQEAQRRVELEIRDAYVELASAVRRRIALEKALEASEESYRLQVEDYRLRLVSNLDVLQALEALQEVRRQTIRARISEYQGYWHLRVATGQTL